MSGRSAPVRAGVDPGAAISRGATGGACSGSRFDGRLLHNVVVHETRDPEVIVVEQEIVGTVIATGKGLTAFGVLVLLVRGDLLINVRDRLDALAINRAMDRPQPMLAALSAAP